ncbi:MAG TPA: ArsI/CadI family heavy metal resistance metalloenzyme [Rhodocyclaceae bacterium]|nr:ArsI/CadI family heavy metal resistance metalloenzyme [Rhodocyclaceae bacterium]
MKRLHIHVAVADLAESIDFYSALFAAEPSVSKPDYAKWMLDDPRMNFAISQRGATPGLDHLGIQVESADELAEMQARLDRLDTPQLAQIGTSCCYARSDKHWVTDPQGIAWESFHSLESVPMFGSEPAPETAKTSACCAPRPVSLGMPRSTPKAICGDSENPTGSACC